LSTLQPSPTARTLWAPRWFSLPCITYRTPSSMCRHSIAIIWSARYMNSFYRTWDFCGAAVRPLRACELSGRTSFPTSPPAKIEVGAFIYENVAGMDAAVAYLEVAWEIRGGPRGPVGWRREVGRAVGGGWGEVAG